MHHARTTPAQLKFTLKKIGEGANALTRYLPAIKQAQRLASRARPKDYLGQVHQIYNDFIKKWRYVFDPDRVEMVHVSGPSLWGEVYGANRNRKAGEHGSGDCDDAAALIAGMLGAIGLKTRIATTSPPGSPQIFSHVFAQTYIPKRGWITVDPVGYPKHGFGWIQPHQRIAYWNLDGKLIGAQGSLPKNFRLNFGLSGEESRGIEMYGLAGLAAANEKAFPDYGLETMGFAGTDNEEPEDWSKNVLVGFGAYVNQMPVVDGSHILMETDEDDEIGDTGLVRTKMLEMSPEDMQQIQQTGFPRPGAVALADDGEIYQYTPNYDGLGGFFKRLRKRIKKRIKKAVKRVRKIGRKLIKKLPGGKYLLKISDKIHKISMKLVRPLAKVVGKWAKRLAPIAAFIPGYGPAIAGALMAAGAIANVINKVGARVDRITGKPKFKSGRQAKQFQRLLKREAQKMKRSGQAKRIVRQTFRKRKVRRRKPISVFPGFRPMQQQMQPMRPMRPMRPMKPFRPSMRLLKKGTPEHSVYMRGMGLEGF